MKTFAANFLDGKKAGSRPVSIQISSPNGILLNDSGSQSYFAFSDLVIGKQLSDHPAIVELPDGGRIEIPEADEFFSTLRENIGGFDPVFWLESRWVSVLSALVLAAVMIWGGITFGIPAITEWAVELIPETADNTIGEQGLALLDKGILAPSELEEWRREELAERFADVVATVGKDHLYRLEFRRGDSIGANALALPSGIVILTDELVKIAESDDEIAMVLAHEVGHVRHRHTLRTIIQNSMVASLIITVTGDVGSVANIAASIPTFLVERSYSRNFEIEADDVAFEFQEVAGIDGEPLADLLLRIDEAYGRDKEISSLLSTHPRSDNRVR